MEKQETLRLGRDMIYLAACALHGRLPEKKFFDKMDLAMVYKMAKFHSMQSIVYICLANCRKEYGEDCVPSAVFAKFNADYQATLKKIVMFDVEREALCSFIGERGWYLCLKGVVLQNYYPTLGMRQMADNDILVDARICPDIRDFLVKRGFKVESFGKGCHDTYLRLPLNFEIHRKLFSEAAKTRHGFDYYKNVKDRLLPGQRRGELIFSDDDFYVYFMFHAYKHFVTAGCGVRTLMDIFVYRTKNERLKSSYIEKQLRSLSIDGYEAASRALAFEIFSPEHDPETELSSDMEELLTYYVTSGTFGTNVKLFENMAHDVTEAGRLPRF